MHCNHTSWRPALPAAVALAMSLAPVVQAQDEPPVPVETLTCQATDGGVLLTWPAIATFARIEGFVVERDGEAIAKIPPGSTSYFDREVPTGTHVYVLSAINWDGNVFALGKCEVSVEDFGLRCSVDGRQVRLKWGPLPIDVWIQHFRILRNGSPIATLPGEVFSYTDTVPDVGEYHYTVLALTDLNSDVSFLVGRCAVDVHCFGMEVAVEGLDVLLAWRVMEPLGPDDPILPPEPESIYIIQRDDEFIAKTSASNYTDTVPGPGLYTYRVWVEPLFGDAPTYLLAACEVAVPGQVLPPPRDLTCRVLEIPPDPVPLPVDPAEDAAGGNADGIDTDGDGVVDSLLPMGVVVLEWVNPVHYDRIMIVRNKVIIATLPGDTTRYVDRVPGGQKYLYSVTGVRENLHSDPAHCTVEVPPGYVPPPQNFTCVLLDMILDPQDPDNPAGGEPGDDGVIAPMSIVLLSWWNPVRYDKLVVTRDGDVLAELEGSAMRYRDVAPPGGEHVYGIFGVWTGSRSRTVLCEIFVGPNPVPPVENLQCTVAGTAAGDPDQPPVPIPSVLLRWENTGRYDAIHIFRNGDPLVQLPGIVESYRDAGVEPGIYAYAVIAVRGGQKSRPALCEVVVPGPQPRNVLYFSPTLPWIEPAGGGDATDVEPVPMPPLPGNRITCMASNAKPLQGWSFGVASDPKFIVAEETGLENTETEAFNGGAGPDFLHVEILPDGRGVVMAVVIDTGSSTGEAAPETLPPGLSHRILNITYGAGESGTPGETYPVRYDNTLGDPPVQVLFVVDGFEVVPATRPGWVSLPGTRFVRGDADENGNLEMADAMRILGWLFLAGPEPGCLEAANANGSAGVNIADPIYILQYLYAGGPQPPYPFPRCGTAPSVLGCEHHEFCNDTAGIP